MQLISSSSSSSSSSYSSSFSLLIDFTFVTIWRRWRVTSHVRGSGAGPDWPGGGANIRPQLTYGGCSTVLYRFFKYSQNSNRCGILMPLSIVWLAGISFLEGQRSELDVEEIHQQSFHQKRSHARRESVRLLAFVCHRTSSRGSFKKTLDGDTRTNVDVVDIDTIHQHRQLDDNARPSFTIATTPSEMDTITPSGAE